MTSDFKDYVVTPLQQFMLNLFYAVFVEGPLKLIRYFHESLDVVKNIEVEKVMFNTSISGGTHNLNFFNSDSVLQKLFIVILSISGSLLILLLGLQVAISFFKTNHEFTSRIKNFCISFLSIFFIPLFFLASLSLSSSAVKSVNAHYNRIEEKNIWSQKEFYELLGNIAELRKIYPHVDNYYKRFVLRWRNGDQNRSNTLENEYDVIYNSMKDNKEIIQAFIKESKEYCIELKSLLYPGIEKNLEKMDRAISSIYKIEELHKYKPSTILEDVQILEEWVTKAHTAYIKWKESLIKLYDIGSTLQNLEDQRSLTNFASNLYTQAFSINKYAHDDGSNHLELNEIDKWITLLIEKVNQPSINLSWLSHQLSEKSYTQIHLAISELSGKLLSDKPWTGEDHITLQSIPTFVVCGFLAITLCVFMMLVLVFIITRIFDLSFLLVISPFILVTSLWDNGIRRKYWCRSFASKAVCIFGIVLSLKVARLIFDVINNHYVIGVSSNSFSSQEFNLFLFSLIYVISFISIYKSWIFISKLSSSKALIGFEILDSIRYLFFKNNQSHTTVNHFPHFLDSHFNNQTSMFNTVYKDSLGQRTKYKNYPLDKYTRR